MKPLDAPKDDEQFTRLLARYSEELACGGAANPAEDPSLAPELCQRLTQALDCLRRLRRFLPPADPKTLPLPESSPATAVLSGSITLHEGEVVGEVGRFRILHTLGHGGGGIVFLAFDPTLRRQVALKVPRLEALLTPELRQRFLREARAAAGLNHPNLVPVYEVGEANGLCFLVSAYCPGGNLAEWLARRNAPPPARLAAELVAELADAVEYIHTHGIYHRDIKPSNILLDRAEARPARELGFTPRLTDFGLAKIHDGQPDATRSGAMIGTAPYMAPEQVEGRGDIDPRTDVYGLGAMLYELLTVRPPFQGATDADTLRQVLEDEPAPPRRLRRDVPRDLETICLKCLKKEPARRYTRAAELAGDLRRFLAHEPIQARPPGRIERLGKWTRRHPACAVLFGASLLIALGLSMGALWLDAMKRAHEAGLHAAAQQDEQRREQLRQHEQRLRQYRYADDIVRSGRDWGKRQLDHLTEQLERHRPAPGLEDVRGFEWYYLSRLSHTLRCLAQPSADSLHCVAFSPQGTTCATGHQSGTIQLWDPAAGRLWQVLTGHKLPVLALAYSPDGKHLVSGGGTTADRRSEGELLLWDVATLKARPLDMGSSVEIVSLAFSPDGLTLAAATAASEVKSWAIPSGRRGTTIPFAFRGVTSVVYAGSATVAVGHVDGKISLCDAARESVLATWQGHQHHVQSVTCSRANASFVSGGRDGKVRLWSAQTPDCLRGEYRHDGEVCSVAISSDGRMVASVSRDRAVKLWDVERRREHFSFTLPREWRRVVTFAPDGKTLAVGCEDGRLWMCDVSRLAEKSSWLGHRYGILTREAWAVAFSPDGKTLASAGDDRAVRLWDPATGRERATLHGHQALVTSLAFSPDGKWLASGSFDESAPVKLWDAVTGAEIATFHGPTRPVDCLAFSPDSKLLAAGCRDNTVRLWDVASRREFDTLSVPKVVSLAFSPDGGLWLASEKQKVLLWDLGRRKIRLTLPPHPKGNVSLALAPNGKRLVTGDSEGTVRFWDAATGALRAASKHHDAVVNCLAFSADGKTLASASFDKTVKLWQTATGRELLTLSAHAAPVRWVSFAPDGKMLATAGHDGVLKIHRAAVEDELAKASP